MSLAMKYVEGKTKEKLNDLKNSDKIDWNNFNWPPFINIVHFSVVYLNNNERDVLKYLKISNYLIFLYFIVLFIENIIQEVYLTSATWVRIFSTIICFVIFFSLKLHLYYSVYLHLLEKKLKIKFLYILEQIILLSFYVSFIIGNYLCFNGFTRIKLYINENSKGFIVVSFIDFIILTLIIICEVKSQLLKYKLN